MPRQSGEDETPFKAKRVTLKELRKLASEGQLRRRRRRSKYRDELLAFKESHDPARKVEGLTTSELAQLVSAIPRIFGPEERVTTKRLDTRGEGANKEVDLLLIKMMPETEAILSNARVYSASKGRVAEAKSEASLES